MTRSRTYWLWLALAYAALIALVGGLALIVDATLNEAQRETFHALLEGAAPVLLYAGALAFVLVAVALHWVFRRYPHAARQLAERTRIVLAANPDYRIEAGGGPEMKELAAVIDQLATAHRQTHREMEARSLEARARVEEERDRFAALMSELTEGVLVCNADGRILLYNERAAQLLGRSQSSGVRGDFIPLGLGRSVFSVLDRDQVAHALDKIHQQFEQNVERPHTRFVTGVTAGAEGTALLRVQVAPFLSGERRVAGMVFTLDDVSSVLGREGQRLKLLQSLATGLRAPVANLRAAAESLIDFPEMPAEQRAQFQNIVAAEARVLTERLNTALREYADALKSSLTLEDMRVVDLLAVVRRRLADSLRVDVRLGEVDADLWVRVDSFTIVQAFASLATRLRDDFGVKEVQLRAAPGRGFAEIDLVWSGAAVGADALSLWEDEPMRAGPEETPLSLKDVLDRHGGEVWGGSDRQRDQPPHISWFRFVLPLGAPVEAAARRAVAGQGRPEYYDFDLFERIESAGALMERRLSELTYTVFDTETTGLEPSAGDEIISIGAVRIVNGRLLKHEVFEQMVNPRRSITREAALVHGIDGRALLAEPTIEQVLPGFHRFCEETVLVAHNAAFDMRFLELKEAATGVRFAQPVLDTLLLSAVVHASLEDHNLDAVAQRLGVRVIGRHTALGDALVTGEVFLRLLPLLAERGIVTLGQALEASRATFHARLQY
ncbi:MAG TPA: exonuclease domain-containing protein [Burkholderiaceae bacterium]|nr:exonuclease domain-containing protein [Burkholderiaceae bacterium]